MVRHARYKWKAKSQFLLQGTVSVLLLFFRSLLVSYSASVRFREANGNEMADNLLDKCMNTIKEILPEGKGKSTLESVPVKATNEFFMVLCRKPSE